MLNHPFNLKFVLFATIMTASNFVAATEEKVGLQLWSLRDSFKEDVFKALDVVHEMGFTYVETAGTYQLDTPAFLAELKKRELVPIAMHIGYQALEEDVDAVIAQAKTLGVEFAICPWIPHEKGNLKAADIEKAASDFNRWGAAFKEAGLRFGYHIHGYEFVPGDGEGKTRFDELMAATNPETVFYQLDVFWAFISAADPVALLETYGSRWISLHVKDLRKGVAREAGTSWTSPENKVVVGTGQIDWSAVYAAAHNAGVTHYIIEDEGPDPLNEIPKSLEFTKGLLK